MTDLDTRSPEFTIAIRGYDRAQVDEYVAYLLRLAADAEGRARNAETEHVFDEHAAVGPRIAEIFALAEAEARELRERVGTEATGLVRDARTEAKAVVDAAEHTAHEIRQRAEHDRGAMLSELERDRERIRDEVNVLELCKAEAVAELSRIREMLDEAAGVAGRARPQAQIGGPTDETVELPAVTDSTKKR